MDTAGDDWILEDFSCQTNRARNDANLNLEHNTGRYKGNSRMLSGNVSKT